MKKARLYFNDDYDEIIERIKGLTDNPSITRIVCVFLDLMQKDEALAKRVLQEIRSHHLDQQLREFFTVNKHD